ncbi:Histone acetyltransferase HPA2 [Minicystis rosea]|nr:Histone acetyltransferase HPA2 [Minicystis rosea]
MENLRTVPLAADHPDAAALLDEYVHEIAERLGGFDPARSVSADPDEMAPPHGVFLVMYDGDRPVACGGLKTIGPGVGEIKRMFVRGEGRGKGYGRRMLAALEAAATQMGLRRIVLDTAAPLAEAEALYRSAGYRSIAPYNDNPYATAWFAKGED